MSIVQKIIAYPLSVVVYVLGLFFIALSQPLQWLVLRVFGLSGHKVIIDVWCKLMLLLMNILGVRFCFENSYELPQNTPIIIVANHQSFLDIPPLYWYFRKLYVAFVAKKELSSRKLMGISYNLRNGGSVFIDRADPRQSLTVLKSFSEKITKNNWAAVIFPEGTRSKNGKPQRFRTTGLQILLKYTPNAYVIPVTIDGVWKLTYPKMFPMQPFIKCNITAHQPIKASEMDTDALCNLVEETIKNKLPLTP